MEVTECKRGLNERGEREIGRKRENTEREREPAVKQAETGTHASG